MITILVALLWTPIAASDPAARPEAMTPYRVEIRLESDKEPMLTSAVLADVARGIRSASGRFLGDAWELDIKISTDAPVEETPPQAEPAPDKTFVVRIEGDATRNRRRVTVREYDAILRDWSPEVAVNVPLGAPLADRTLDAMLSAFRPVARIIGKDRGKAEISFRGNALLPRSTGFQLVPSGTAFQIVRVLAAEPEHPTVVPWSYLVYVSTGSKEEHRFTELATIASAYRDPITKRSRQKMQLWAVACPSGDKGKTDIEFLSLNNGRPIAGYEVSIRPMGETSIFSVGTTDYRGRIAIERSQSLTGGEPVSSLVDVLLLSGQTVVARFPLVPGSPPTLVAKATLDPLLPEVAGEIIALQEDVVDLAARRKLLELRMNKAVEANDLGLTKDFAAKINALPNRTYFKEKLEFLRDRADSRSQELKQKAVGANVKRLFAQTDRLLEAVPLEQIVVEINEEPPASPDGEESSSGAP